MESKVDRAPAFTGARASDIAHEWFGVGGRLAPLPSERDQNFLVTEPSGRRHVLKIGNTGEPREVLELQNLALDHLQRRIAIFNEAGAPFRFEAPWPAVRRSRDGETIVELADGRGRVHPVRLLSWVPGKPFGSVRPHRPRTIRSLGAFIGALDRALEGFTHPAAGREFLWDLARAGEVVRRFAPEIEDPSRRSLVEIFAERFEEGRARLERSRRAIIHNDANDYNVMVDTADPAGPHVSGIVDFGDMLDTWLVAEPAIAAAYVVLDKADPLGAAAELVGGYHRAFPLEESELEQLYGLLCMRLVMSVCISAHQLKLAPDNAYLGITQLPAWRTLERLAGISPDLAHYRLRDACGLVPRPRTSKLLAWLDENGASARSVLPEALFDRPPLVFDLSVGSIDPAATLPADRARAYRPQDAAAWTQRLFGLMRDAGAAVGVGRYDEPRRVYTTEQFDVESDEQPRRRTIHLGIDLFAPAGTPVRTPYDARVESVEDHRQPLDYGPTVMLAHDAAAGAGEFYTLYGHLGRESIGRLRPGTRLRAGEPFATLGTAEENGGWPPHLHFQIVTDRLGQRDNFPGVAPPEERAVWRSICPDPNLVLRIPAVCFPQPAASAGAIAERRKQVLGPSLSLAHRRPLHIVRGVGQYLYDAEGRCYLDAVNNVCHVGHSHPRVVAAAQAQAAVLNTNTRYLHERIVEYVERLLETVPRGLDTCFLVCSGSEANELALRMARAHSGRHGVIAVEGGYHGNTQALVDVSSYKYAGKGGAGRPRHVAELPMPDPYRGRYRGAEAGIGERYAAHVDEAARELEQRGIGVSAFICESVLSCGGQVVLPPRYLATAYAHARRLGAVIIADEVQVGFGRVGRHFWAFELQGVVPDIVTLGKPIGNGHPLAAVITRRAVAESFANGMEYFNTFGGNPVSCAVGLAVLDVIRDEGLQLHALQVGSRLKQGLTEIMPRHPLVGEVRGEGLFLGVELVLDPDERTPAPEQAAYVQERLREHGILVGIDGPRHNVLKIKPPLVFDERDADRLVETLDRVLGESFLGAGDGK